MHKTQIIIGILLVIMLPALGACAPVTEDAVAELQTRITNLEKELSAKAATINKLRQEIQNKQTQIAKLEEELSAKVATIDPLRQEIQENKNRIEELEKALEKPLEPIPTTIEVKVLRVIDGDTIEVDIKGATYKVRYIGIDAPELDDERAEFCALAQEATRYNRQLVEGKAVRLEKDISETDKYGRLLRYVYLDDIFVNAELVRLGYAQVTTSYPLDVKYQDVFLQLQTEAKEAGRRLWVTRAPPTPTPPLVEAPTVQITYIFYDGLVFRVESDEYVEITNLGDQPQDLAHWVLKDVSEGYPSFTFPSYILAPGKSIRVYTNENHPEWGGFSFEYSRAIWHNSAPDVAVLYNSQGKEVSRKSY